MPSKVKIAISISREALELVDRNAAGRSRSVCIEEEIVRALRAREWAILSAATSTPDAEEALAWAEQAFELVDNQLTADEIESIDRRERKKNKSDRSRRRARAGAIDPRA